MHSNSDYQNEPSASSKTIQQADAFATDNGENEGEKLLKDTTDSWKRKRKLLRPAPSGIAARLFGDGIQSPLCWTLPSAVRELELVARLQKWHVASQGGKKLSKTAGSIVAAVDGLTAGRADLESALTALGAAQASGWLGDHVDEVTWQLTIGKLVSFAAASDVDCKQQPWLYQLCEVELPLTLSWQRPEIAVTRKLGKRAVGKMSRLVNEILDGDGWPVSRFLGLFGPLVASWARCLAIAKALKLKIPKATALQLEWVVRQTIRLARQNGTLLGSDHESEPCSPEFVQTMLQMSADRTDWKIAEKCLSVSAPAKRKSRDGRVPQESGLSEWAAVGVLQSGWKRNACKLALTWGDRQSWIELARQVSLIAGDCTPAVSINGKPLVWKDEFELVCENLEDEIDYLELQLHTAPDVTLHRQIIFGKRDQFAMVADVVHCQQPARIDYRCEFPLAPGMRSLEESQTREIYLRDQKIRSLVLPLALPEWKAARTDDRLVCQNDRLILQQNSYGQGLCAALFFDLNPKRSVKPRTWRQLTVAEMLKIVDKDVAVAYRVQVGKEQWVYYRSIGAKGNRTFLGQNVAYEFFFGRFSSSGEMKELLLIE